MPDYPLSVFWAGAKGNGLKDELTKCPLTYKLTGLLAGWLFCGLSAAPPQTHRASLKRNGLSTAFFDGCRPSPKGYALTQAY